VPSALSATSRCACAQAPASTCRRGGHAGSPQTEPGTWNTLHSTSAVQKRCYNQNSYIVHSKNMMIDGMYDGSHQRLVWTGSHNWSGPALRNNDEALLKIKDQALYDTFVQNFDQARAAAQPGTADNVLICKSDDAD
jgi:phosphatidylserine/phosphatidylglycerophosphate/cardiolipin synthase-like enzyme